MINILDDGNLSNLLVNVIPFNLYPNPVNNELFIDTSLTNYNLSIYNMHGQLLIHPFNYSGSQTFNFNSFPPGMYLLKVITEAKTKVFKILKE